VEDEPSVRNVAARTLQRCGYRVVEAVNGYEALRQWETCNGQIDLLFSDVIMPGGMTGLELAARLKQAKAGLKVIISSGYSPDLAGKDRTFFQRNQSCFLQKPYAPRVLLETVRRCLDEGTSVSGSL
jgi:two-component system cell cycle sensor histidine kinase/response regulator CckA